MRLSPLAYKELLVPNRSDPITPAALASVACAGLLAVTWLVPHPIMLQVRHVPLALACGLTFVQHLAGIHRANAVLEERAGGTYETLILAGASGSRFVAGMVQASVLAGLQLLALATPVFAAAAAALGTPLTTLAAFYALLAAQLVLGASLAVLGASEPPSTTARRAGAGTTGYAMSGAALLLPFANLLLTLPTVLLAIRGAHSGWFANTIGDAAYLPLLFCPPAVFAVDTLHLAGVAVPFLPLALAANLAAAAIPFAHAAARHRLHRHDDTQVRRALTFAACVTVLALTAATAARLPVLLVLGVHLALMLAVAPNATAPAWPALGAGAVPGRGRFSDLFRERSGTGLAFVALCCLAAAPFYALADGTRALRVFAWLYGTVLALTWALLAWELPASEPEPRSGLGLRTAVVLLAAISVATVLWDETVVEKQPPLLVAPVRAALGAATLSTPLSGALGLYALQHPLPVIRRGNLAGAAMLCRTSPEGLLILSLGWHALLAVLAFLRTRWLLRR